MDKTIVRFGYLFSLSLFVVISLTVSLSSNKPPSQARADISAQANTTIVPTVTGWPSQTPTVTPSPIPPGIPSPTPTETSYPGPPRLIFPPDGALMPQPVSPDVWHFRWSADCGACWGAIYIHGPGGREIKEYTEWAQEFQYTSDTFLPDDALGPWTWGVGVCKQLGCNVSETRTFWVLSVTVKTTPEFLWYLPGVLQGPR
jgi:hypothetical protein